MSERPLGEAWARCVREVLGDAHGLAPAELEERRALFYAGGAAVLGIVHSLAIENTAGEKSPQQAADVIAQLAAEIREQALEKLKHGVN